jgi:L-ascorbate metabolism protein UlaG (beta-lactamase superfamily)
VLRSRIGPPRRRGPAPRVDELGRIDAVLISHAHPDHFDRLSIRKLEGHPAVVVPRGLGKAARRMGADIWEMGVGDRIEIKEVAITGVHARHGRWPLERRSRPLGYLIEGSTRVYFAGDTARFRKMTDLAGRVDVALLPVGRWGPPVGPSRLTPSTAVSAALDVGAKVAIPIHWGTLYVPGFQGGRWGWGALEAGHAFEREAQGVLGIEAVVLQPGESREIEMP